MATYSTGISAAWGGSAFAEIVDVSVSYGGGSPKGRATPWTDDLGTVSLTCLAGTNMSTAEYGQRKTLAISGGGVSISIYAVCEGLTVTPELNGVTRYTATYKILDG